MNKFKKFRVQWSIAISPTTEMKNYKVTRLETKLDFNGQTYTVERNPVILRRALNPRVYFERDLCYN